MRAVRLWSWEYCRANIDPAAREGASDRQERGEGLPTTGAVFLESEISVLGWCKSHLIYTHTSAHTHTGHRIRTVVVLERMGNDG